MLFSFMKCSLFNISNAVWDLSELSDLFIRRKLQLAFSNFIVKWCSCFTHHVIGNNIIVVIASRDDNTLRHVICDELVWNSI